MGDAVDFVVETLEKDDGKVVIRCQGSMQVLKGNINHPHDIN